MPKRKATYLGIYVHNETFKAQVARENANGGRATYHYLKEHHNESYLAYWLRQWVSKKRKIDPLYDARYGRRKDQTQKHLDKKEDEYWKTHHLVEDIEGEKYDEEDKCQKW